jgi:hypothetical protein
MVAALNSVSTKTTGWQEKCWNWAESQQPFEIRDMTSSHFMFCQELCGEYNYTYVYRCSGQESVAQFKHV